MNTSDTFDPVEKTSDNRVVGANVGLLLSLVPIVLSQLRGVIKELGDEHNSKFEELVNKQTPSARQLHQLDAVRWLQQHHAALTSNVLDEFNSAFQHARTVWMASPSSDRASLNLSALSLLGDAEMDESLAVANLARKGENAHSDQLNPLLQRLNALPNCNNITEQNNPFGPYVIADVLRTALVRFKDELTHDLRITLIKFFESTVMPELAEMYSLLNAKLADAGVLPDLHFKRVVRQLPHALRHETEKSPNLDNTRKESQEIASEGQKSATANGDPGVSSNELFEMIQQLLSVHRNGAESVPSVDEFGQPITRGGYQPASLLSAVSLIQHHSPTDSEYDANTASIGPIDLAKIKQQLTAELTRNNAQHAVGLSQLDEDTIDIVGNLFNVILEDPHLAEPIKAQIARLQIPLLKVALIDKTFFADPENSARRLVNQLALAGAGWVQDETYRDDPLYAKITEIVTCVLDKFDRDLGLFTTLLEDLLNFCAKSESESVTLRERLESAREAASMAIEAHLSGSDVPQWLADFCRTIWLRYLVQLREKQGVESTLWENALDVLKNLLWSVLPKKEVTEKRLMAMMIPQLITDLEEGMAAIDYSAAESQAFLTLLQDIHLTSLRGKTPVKDAELTENTLASASLAAPNDAKSSAIAELMALPLGGWVEFKLYDGKRKRGRLVWRDVFSNDLTFADWRFKIIVDANVARLADDFIEGRLRILAVVPLFDRAVTALMAKLKASIPSDK